MVDEGEERVTCCVGEESGRRVADVVGMSGV